MKLNIKNTLIGLLVVGFFGLIYAVLSSRPEMVADNSLRVEEAPLKSPSTLVNDFNSGGAADSLVSANTSGDDVQSFEVERVEEVPESVDESDSPFANDVQVDYLKPVPLLATIVVLDGESVTQEELAENELSQSVSALSTTDVSVISSSDEFINLNLVETKPIEMVIIEGDDLILDDVTEGLGKYQSIVEKYSTGSTVDARVDQAISTAKTNLDLLDSESASDITSTIVIPEVDEALMSGTDKVSLEYQATMQKLLDVKLQMAEADAENARLKAKFSSVVDQNRELAILIRDIDVKIKTLTASN